MTSAAHELQRVATLPPPRRHYARAPIIETIIELRVNGSEGMNVSSLEGVRSAEDIQRYPEMATLFQSEAGFEIDATGASRISTSPSAVHGYQFRDPVGARFFQAKTSGFSFHKHAPYTQWEDCRDEARRLWELYREVARPTRISRIGLRYVNRLDLPARGELKDYLLTVPEIAPGLPQELGAYAMQLSIPIPELQSSVLVIRQAMVEPDRVETVSILLDFDLVQVLDLDPTSDAVWDALESLHEHENEVFERCITNRTRLLIT